MLPPDRTLLAILAAVDAAFLPERPTGSNKGDVRAALLRTPYLSGVGIPWSSGRASAQEKMAASRVLAELEDAGQVIRHAAGQRTSHVRLTDAGEARARSLVGLPSLADAMLQGRKFAKFVDPGRWIIEIPLAGLEMSDYPKDRGIDDPLMNLEERLLPLLIRGWAQSIEDAHGHVSYRLSYAGAAAVAGKLPADPADSYDEECMNFYYDSLGRELERIRVMPAPCRLIMPMRSCSDAYYSAKEHGRRGRNWPRNLDSGEDNGAEP
ncbi:MAG: hypothetical protein H0X38_02440 [Planctomycetes bacterium]|nr:hypothetical protein [Planctomycetota bacterium]